MIENKLPFTQLLCVRARIKTGGSNSRPIHLNKDRQVVIGISEFPWSNKENKRNLRKVNYEELSKVSPKKKEDIVFCL